MAIQSFTKAIQIESNKADFYHNRGFAYRKQKKYELAIQDYSKAISLDNSHFKAYYNRAFCWDKIGQVDQAESDYLKAIEIQPQNLSALYHLGTVREKMGGDKTALALENFNEVLSIDEHYAPAFNGRGLCWDKLFQFEEALTDFTNAIKLD